jgi:thioredoxin 1
LWGISKAAAEAKVAAVGSAKETTDKTFYSEVLNAKTLVLVVFWAPYCGPCRRHSPIIDEFAKDFAGKIEVYKCNVVDNPETPTKFGVRGIPSLIIFKDGKLVDCKVGPQSRASLVEWITPAVEKEEKQRQERRRRQRQPPPQRGHVGE